MRTLYSGIIAASLICAAATSASATTIISPLFTCTSAPNCGSASFLGNINDINGAAATPWVAQLFAQPNSCLRLDVVQEDTDLRMVVVAPNGAVFSNDDRASGDPRPLVKINNTQHGFYTVQVDQWQGAPVSANFNLNYGNYNLNNPACSSASAAVVTSTASKNR